MFTMSTLADKDTIMKRLLSSPPKTGGTLKMEIMKHLRKEEDYEFYGCKLSSYLEHLSGQSEPVNATELDHSYSKPFNWRPDSAYANPIKSLFVGSRACEKSSDKDEILDPVGETVPPKPAYDEDKAKRLMNDTWRQIRLLRADVGDLNWESNVNRTDWTPQQRTIFDNGVKILNYDRASRLSFVGHWNEPALCRITIDKSAKRLRILFAAVAWQYNLIRWLHFLWLDLLHHEYLVAYVEILQTLKKKVPELIDRLYKGPVPSTSKANAEMLNILLQSPWDPGHLTLPCHSQRKLPGNPLLLIVPCGSSNSNIANSRIQRWYNHLAAIGTVMMVNTNKLNTSKVTVTNSLEHLMASTRSKIADLKSDYIGRNIILIGLNSGAALACQVSLVESVTAVVCLGFPINTVEEKRGQPDDSLLNLSVPTLFVIGQHAATSHVNDIEDLRERLRVKTSLVVIGSADDCLRVPNSKKLADGITQTMIDRCIVDEISDFIISVLLTPNQNEEVTQPVAQKPKMKLVERKRKISLNEDTAAAVPKKSRITLSPAQSGLTFSMTTNRPRKSATPRNTGGSGRNSKWSNETDGRIQTISRKTLLVTDDKSILSRPSIDNIRIINKNVSFKGNSVADLFDGLEDGDAYNIMSEIKVISPDDNDSFVGQLTADRLLEMPVIIAQDDPSVAYNTAITAENTAVTMSQPVKVMVTSGLRDNVRNSSKSTTAGGGLSQVQNIRIQKTSTIQIARSNSLSATGSSSAGSVKSDVPMNTKCATIYFHDQAIASRPTVKLHKMDIVNRVRTTGGRGRQQQQRGAAAIGRRQFAGAQLVPRRRIKHFPAVQHSGNDMNIGAPMPPH